jgi:hypothetical protein
MSLRAVSRMSRLAAGRRVAGSLAMFDRMIFKGHLSGLYKGDNARCFLWSQGWR